MRETIHPPIERKVANPPAQACVGTGGWRRCTASRRSPALTWILAACPSGDSPSKDRVREGEEVWPARGTNNIDRRSMLRAKSMSSRGPVEARVTYRSFLLDLDRPRVSPREYVMPRREEWRGQRVKRNGRGQRAARWPEGHRARKCLGGAWPSSARWFNVLDRAHQSPSNCDVLLSWLRQGRSHATVERRGSARSRTIGSRSEWTLPAWSSATADRTCTCEAVRRTLRSSVDIPAAEHRVPIDSGRIIDVPAPRSDPRPSVVTPCGDGRRVPIGKPGADACTEDGSKNSRSCVRVEH